MKKEHLFIASLALIILFAFMVEITSHFFYEKVTLSAGRKSVEILLGEKDIAEYSAIMPHAFMLYLNRPLWNDGQYTQNNSLGYRGREFSLKPIKNTIRILTLGGSTTYDQGVQNPDKTWTAKLGRLFNRNGYKVETINGGLNAATSAEVLSQYMYKHRYIKPDIVILNIAWNDAATLLYDDYEPSYGSYRKWAGISVNARTYEKTILHYSYFMRILYAWWLGNPKLSDLILFPSQKLTREIALKNVRKNEPVGLEKNAELLIRNINADGAQPIFFIEAIASPGIFKTYHNEEVEQTFPALQLAFEKDKMVIRMLAEKYHVPLIEIPNNEIPVADFVDHGHVNEMGSAFKAQFIYENFPMSILRRKE